MRTIKRKNKEKAKDNTESVGYGFQPDSRGVGTEKNIWAESSTCLCGKLVVAVAYLPIGNVYAGLKEVCERHMVCEYHAEKARNKGYRVE